MKWRSLTALLCLILVLISLYILGRSAQSFQYWLGAATLVALIFVWGLPRPAVSPNQVLPKVHFPGLNGLRFIAAFLVIIHHIEQAKLIKGFPSLWNSPHWGPFVSNAGGLGVTFFFVLSGFLITYLLLVERQHTGTISLKEFYIRRALRIWPVYFFLTFFCFFLLPRLSLLHIPGMAPIVDQDYWAKIALFLVMWPQVFLIIHPGLFYGGVLWTVGVEEHFYFLWPLIIRWLGNRILFLMLALVPLLAALKQPHQLWHYFITNSPPAETEQRLRVLGEYFHYFRIDCMAIGAIGAWLALHNTRVLQVIFHPIAQRVIAATAILCLYKGQAFSYFHDDVYALFFLIMILNVAVNKRSLLRMENRVWEFLGRISYGLYAYNWLAVPLTLNLIVGLPYADIPWVRNVYIYTGTFVSLTLFASASYYLMERRFLRLKRKFGSFSRVAVEGEGINTSLPVQPA